MSIGNVKGVNSGGDLQFQDKAAGNVVLGIQSSNKSIEPVAIGRTARKYTPFGLTLAAIGDTAAAPTAAQVLGGVIEHLANSPRTFTLPTAALLDGALSGPAVGDCFELVIANTGSSTSTITAPGDASVTLKGSVAITTGKTGYILFYRTAGTPTYNAYCSVG